MTTVTSNTYAASSVHTTIDDAPSLVISPQDKTAPPVTSNSPSAGVIAIKAEFARLQRDIQQLQRRISAIQGVFTLFILVAALACVVKVFS